MNCIRGLTELGGLGSQASGSDDYLARNLYEIKRFIDENERLEPLCGCTPVELLEASQEELLRDQAEAVRLAYVAATRARDLLVVPACGDRPLTGWLEVVNPALYPPDDAKAQSEPVPGAPSFGEESASTGVLGGGSRWRKRPSRSP